MERKLLVTIKLFLSAIVASCRLLSNRETRVGKPRVLFALVHILQSGPAVVGLEPSKQST